MEFALAIRGLLRHWLLLAIGVLVAAIAATFSVYRVEGGTLKSRALQYSSASTQVLIDTPSSVLGNLSQSFEPLSARAAVYADFMTSPAILAIVGRQVGILGEQIYATGPVNLNQPPVVVEPTALKRNVQITGETKPYRLNFENQVRQPTINIFSQAPTTGQAVALANAAAVGLKLYVTGLENADRIPSRSRVTIRQLGSANGAVVNGGVSKALAAIVFVAVLLLCCVLILAGARLRETWRASAALQRGLGDDDMQNATGRGGGGANTPEAVTSESGALAPEIRPFETPAPRDEDRVAVPTRSAP